MTVGAVGALLGPLVAGWLIDIGYPGLGWISYSCFMIIAVPIVVAFYPNFKTHRTTNAKFDFVGVFLLAVGLCCIMLWLCIGGVLIEWLSGISAVLLVVGIISLVALVRREGRHENPSVPVKVFRHKRFTTAFLCNLLLCAFSLCTAAYVIAFVQQVMQVSATVSATVTMPQTIVVAVFSAIIGRWLGASFTNRFRPLTVAAMFLISMAMLILCTLNSASSMLLIYVATAIGGLGMIVPQAAFTPYFQVELPLEEYRAAQSMFSFAASCGTCIFGAFAGVILNAGMGYCEVFLLGMTFCAVAFIIGFINFRLPIKASPNPET